MPDLFSPPYFSLVAGFAIFLGAVVSVCTGKTLARFRGLVYRDKDPSNFWWAVAVYFVTGVLLVVRFLSDVGAFSN